METAYHLFCLFVMSPIQVLVSPLASLSVQLAYPSLSVTHMPACFSDSSRAPPHVAFDVS